MTSSYGQFCPISMAAEVVCTRWTVLVIRELLCGSTRFNDLRRGVPRMSPTLLSKRLKEMELLGVIRVEPTAQPGISDYVLTEAGEALRPLVMGLGTWGYRWMESTLSLRNLDPTLLMWDMHRRIDARPFPAGRSTIQFVYPELPESHRDYWLVIEDGTPEVCWVDPGYEIDLWVRCPLSTMTAVWMGYSTLRAEIAAGTIEVDGNPALARSMPVWLGLSVFAKPRDQDGMDEGRNPRLRGPAAGPAAATGPAGR
ncbi:winged helix-turn-helix transcriptional regulator [Cereibacter sphaeroides]|uniref:winged helix-turn-helix transcriptional regulator n=1 Tax=Cereibacter sphaeroides TaxID=1063 RepID=UPI001F416BE7|nr:winged helix-turn-helix transcriptional regulator [Cereibacter sphaeroides]MCE6950642.1 winged helix-turn-helix transcriptional regulator [Cereibacter sphaeroides]